MCFVVSKQEVFILKKFHIALMYPHGGAVERGSFRHVKSDNGNNIQIFNKLFKMSQNSPVHIFGGPRRKFNNLTVSI